MLGLRFGSPSESGFPSPSNHGLVTSTKTLDSKSCSRAPATINGRFRSRSSPTFVGRRGGGSAWHVHVQVHGQGQPRMRANQDSCLDNGNRDVLGSPGEGAKMNFALPPREAVEGARSRVKKESSSTRCYRFARRSSNLARVFLSSSTPPPLHSSIAFFSNSMALWTLPLSKLATASVSRNIQFS